MNAWVPLPEDDRRSNSPLKPYEITVLEGPVHLGAVHYANLRHARIVNTGEVIIVALSDLHPTRLKALAVCLSENKAQLEWLRRPTTDTPDIDTSELITAIKEQEDEL